MTAGALLSDDLRARLRDAHASVIVDCAPDWWALVQLACDVLIAGVETPAAADLAGLPEACGRSECEPLFRQMFAELGLPSVADHPKVLQHRIAEGDIDAVLAEKPLPEIAAAWQRHQRRTPGDEQNNDPDSWAADLWHSPAWYDGDWPRHELILELIHQADSDDELGMIAASTLENCISEEEATLQWVEEQAALSPKFRKALAGVWVYDCLTPASFQRVERSAGTPLANPKRID